ncbi:hypothetical protein BEP19_04415 [Ammoniphilus oxalaticus]|uniref:histidine kinase n=1 Tax=Ammoniphilus oxalaticus TaxID=66863 RepID=A0A419SLY0_9BACL|nr:histidine kinase dimerization/phospho-acceptor domain-containing protein [Ammoniphilus oxalaticus]RKD25071.1 hypothetical protein BEP19_04415 [Ammoniphilus oxalaticus]
MDTKWKNNWARVIVWLLLFSHGVHGVMTTITQGPDYIGKNYFGTHSFQFELNRYIDDLLVFELNYIPIEEAKKQITVTSEEIEEHRLRYGELPDQVQNIKDQYEDKINQAIANNNQQNADAYTAERDRKIEDITENFRNDEHVLAKVAKEKEAEIDEIYKGLDRGRTGFKQHYRYFVYRITDKETGQVYSNLSAKDREQKIRDGQMAYLRDYSLGNSQSVQESHHRTGGISYSGDIPVDHPYKLPIETSPRNFEGQIGVTNAIKTSSDYAAFQSQQRLFYVYAISGVVSLLISLFVVNRWQIIERIAPRTGQATFNRVPLDFAAGITAIALFIAFNRLDTVRFIRVESVSRAIRFLFYNSLWTGLAIALLIYLYRRLKEGSDPQADFRGSMTARIWQTAQESFLIRSTGVQIFLILLFALGLGPGAIIVYLFNSSFLFVLYCGIALLIGLPLLYLILRQAGYFNKIALYLENIVQGYAVPDLTIKGQSKLAKIAENVNRLKQGVKVSQQEQAKSERLKTELITNVSHDLRTPLTSVITYTELLKQPNLSDEERASYVGIIDQKSKRLKVLIDDLFEASKMASGSVELTKQKVDLVQLLQQALAEYDEQIKTSGLQFRITTPETPVYALVDGQKVWRAFDNLIYNILKYSLEHTRVYISVQADGSIARIIFRNIAKYELGENVDELFERFKRGDTSRQTEGSGLGLAIAKSIIDLHDGSLDIEVDGDLFKVTISLQSA